MTERLSLMDWVFQSTTLFKSLYVNWDTNKWFLVIFTPQISPTQWEPIFKYFLSLLHVELCESLDHLFTLTVGNKHLNYNGNPLQYFCLENPMDRGAWQAPVHAVAKSWTWLTDFHFTSRSTKSQSKPDILIKGWLTRLLLIIVYLEK